MPTVAQTALRKATNRLLVAFFLIAILVVALVALGLAYSALNCVKDTGQQRAAINNAARMAQLRYTESELDFRDHKISATAMERATRAYRDQQRQAVAAAAQHTYDQC